MSSSKAEISLQFLEKGGYSLAFNREEWAISAGPEGSGESGDSRFLNVSTQMSLPIVLGSQYLLPNQGPDLGVANVSKLRIQSLL